MGTSSGPERRGTLVMEGTKKEIAVMKGGTPRIVNLGGRRRAQLLKVRIAEAKLFFGKRGTRVARVRDSLLLCREDEKSDEIGEVALNTKINRHLWRGKKKRKKI